MTNYISYYKAEAGIKLPVWQVLLIILFFLSGIQYVNDYYRWQSMQK